MNLSPGNAETPLPAGLSSAEAARRLLEYGPNAIVEQHVVGVVAYAHMLGMTVPRIIPLMLTALPSAVPVALPATFTLLPH